MSEQPQTWHYGLVARWWAEFNAPDPDELAFYRSVIEGDGQPALDLACGAGRLLLPLLSAGLDVDGCDISPDMLALCQEGAARQGLAPRLYQQAMHDLDLPRSYRTIYYLRFIRPRWTPGSGRGGAKAVLRPSCPRRNARLQSLSSQRRSSALVDLAPRAAPAAT